MGTSIVIPCYNLARFLPEAIESALAQGADEVIVSDNWSADDTSAVARRYPGVKLIRPPEFMDIPHHFRFLVREASQEWVVTLSADDRMRPSFLRVCRRAADRHPEVAYVTTGFRMIDESGNVMGVHPGWPWRSGLRRVPADLRLFSERGFGFNPNATLFRRSELLPMLDRSVEIGVAVACDVYCALGLSTRFPAYRIFGAHCDYRRRKTSSSQSKEAICHSDAVKAYLDLRRRSAGQPQIVAILDRFGQRMARLPPLVGDGLSRLSPEEARPFVELAVLHLPTQAGSWAESEQRILQAVSRLVNKAYLWFGST